MKQTFIDVSIVMNAHRSVLYYERAIKSLEEAVKYAASYGILSELVIVLDTPDQETIDWFNNYETTVFSRCQTVRVNYGSLGAARNSGIKISNGHYIMTYDDDDLISYNYIKSMYDAAADSETEVVIFPEYLFSFGDGRQLCKYHTFPKLSRLAFLEAHALTSRFLASRDVFEKISYLPVKIGDAFSFEDWHFNCEIIAKEIEIKIAVCAVLFYRERINGSAWAMTNQGTGQIPHSNLFCPSIYNKICMPDYQNYKSGKQIFTPAFDIIDSFVNNKEIIKQVEHACQIDGAINLDRIEDTFAHTNKDRSLELGAAYFDICAFIADTQFTDILIVDFEIFYKKTNTLEHMQIKSINKNIDSRFLVIVTSKSSAEILFSKEKEGIYIIHVDNLFELGSFDRINILLLKLIQSYSAHSNLHLYVSTFAIKFFDKYHSATEEMNRILYYRCTDREQNYVQTIELNEAIAFAKKYRNSFSKFMTDDISAITEVNNNRRTEDPMWQSIKIVNEKNNFINLFHIYFIKKVFSLLRYCIKIVKPDR